MEVLGDRWSLVVIRDMMFGNRRHFRDLLTHSEERIASNILAARLKRLVALGLIGKQDDPSHSQKAIYSLTEPAIQLVPVFATIGSLGGGGTYLSARNSAFGHNFSRRAVRRCGKTS
jgi:DNA-binding HxlR family transcriptional regulator